MAFLQRGESARGHRALSRGAEAAQPRCRRCRLAPGGAGPVRTGAVEEQQRSEAVQQLGQPVPPQVLAALLLARRHPAVPGRPEAVAGPAAGAVRARGGTSASKGARSGSSRGTLAGARGKGEGKTDFPGSRHVSTGTDTPRSRLRPGSALVRGEKKITRGTF